MTSAQRTPAPALASTAADAPLIPIYTPRELATLGELLDACEDAQIRVYLDGAGDLRYQAPRGAMTPDLRARIAERKGALVRSLRAAGAQSEPGAGEDGPRVPSARGACHDATHSPRPPVYSYTLGRWLCATCEPDVYALFIRAVQRAYDGRTRRAGAPSLDADAAEGQAGAPSLDAPRLDRGPLMRELLAWGEAHEWPRLAYGWRTGAGDDHRPYKWIVEGAAAWRRFVTGNPAAELLGAQRAAAAYPQAPAPVEARAVVGAQAQESPAAVPDASMIADRAPDGAPAQAGTGASLEERDTRAGEALDASACGAQGEAAELGERMGEASDPPREWAECFAALDAGGLWLARIGSQHRTAGAPERRELDDLTRPDPSSAGAARLVAYMERERITQLWVHATWAAAAGLPMRILSDRELHDGIPHAFTGADMAASWATQDSPASAAGSWGMYHAGRLAPWMRFYRRGEAGSIAIAVPHLDGRIPWRQAADGRELLAAILAYRAALRGFAYRSGPGASSTALLRVVHRGSSAALDLSASASPQDFPAPARVPGLMPQWGWIRERTAEERERGRYVIGLDKNGMFLAASSSLRLGLGAAPVHLDAADPAVSAPQLAAAVEALTDWHTRPRPRRPVGYWLARVTFRDGASASSSAPYPHAPLLPHPCYTGPAQADPAASWQWYVSATLELAAELGAHVEAREAYLWPRDSIHEPLEPWYQRLRDARAGLMRESATGAPGAALALAAVKATYTQGIGWLDASWLRKGEDPADLYRPDWRHAIHGTANANLWRNLARALDASGRAPFAILTDAAYYLTDNPDPLALAAELGLRMGEGLGQYKVKLAALDAATLAPVWELLAAGREVGRVVSEFAAVIRESEA